VPGSIIQRLGPLILAVLAALLPAPAIGEEAGAKTPHAVLAPGGYSFMIEHHDIKRTYLVHMPPQAAGGTALPVVMNFHGAGSNGKQQEQYSEMDAAADRDGFIAVYPDGTGRFRNHYTWDAGFCCGYAMRHRIDDVGFVVALIDDLAVRTPILSRRVYATGISNGAMMSYRLAAQASSHIAAIAPVAGGMVIKTFMPVHPMPIMHFHSVDDPLAHYNGGYGRRVVSLFRRDMGNPPVEKVIARWTEFNGCPEHPQVGATLDGQPGTNNQGITVTRYDWDPCRNGTEVVLWKFTGSGHVWPGGIQDRSEKILGRSTNLIDANEQMWRFFNKFELPRQ
jgi:polyhydroxybutyrate depolymerase